MGSSTPWSERSCPGSGEGSEPGHSEASCSCHGGGSRETGARVPLSILESSRGNKDDQETWAVLKGSPMPTLTIEYRDEDERLALEQAIAYVTDLRQLAVEAPAGTVLEACEGLALD